MELNKIYCGDFRSIKITENSIDMIFTDPPYIKNGIPLYEDVAKLGSIVLKPGGFLIVYASDYWLNKTFPSMLEYLNYFYLYHHINSQTASIFPRKLWAKGKSLIAFNKGKPNLDNIKWHNNYYAPDKKCKSHRKDNWEQTVAEAQFFINNFSQENDVILDPMCGSGTTCVAAKQLDRNYIGIDISEEQCKMTESRLNEI